MNRIRTIPALVVREPYLELILRGVKDVEVRSLSFPSSIVGRTVLLCAASRVVFPRSALLETGSPWALLPDPRSPKGEAMVRAMAARAGKTAALVAVEESATVPEAILLSSLVEEARRACVPPAYLPGKKLFFLGDPTRLDPRPTRRVRPDGTIAAGGFLGAFPAPAEDVHFPGELELL